MDITLLTSNNSDDTVQTLEPSETDFVTTECAILLIMVSVRFAGAAYVIGVYLYELKVKRPLILAYYSFVMMAATAKMTMFAWCIIYPFN